MIGPGSLGAGPAHTAFQPLTPPKAAPLAVLGLARWRCQDGLPRSRRAQSLGNPPLPDLWPAAATSPELLLLSIFLEQSIIDVLASARFGRKTLIYPFDSALSLPFDFSCDCYCYPYLLSSLHLATIPPYFSPARALGPVHLAHFRLRGTAAPPN
jgi:hypothetical protein